MADGFDAAAQKGLRAALIAAPGVAALVGGRVVDEPRADLAFPYIRFGEISPVPDDTDGTRGAIVQVGLEIHSRPKAGRVEAARICAAINEALHLRPEVMTAAPYKVTEIEVQTWLVQRQKDGATYEGRLALQVHLDS